MADITMCNNKKCKDRFNCHRFTATPNEHWNKIKDYIINLQEENEKYKKIFEGKERFSKIMPEDTEFVILTKENYDRQEKDIQLELIDYKSRCEKAIEYINKLKSYPFLERYYIKDLLNILNGGDE